MTAATYLGLTIVQWMTIAVFTATIITIVINKLDATVAALLGVAVMIWMGTMTDIEAAKLVDWNVMAILIGIWVIAGYFGKSGVPSWLSVKALEMSGGRPGLLVMILSMLTGILSMFIDNVVCILMMAPVALPLARAMGIPATPLVLMIGFSANFMGTSLLLGDQSPPLALATVLARTGIRHRTHRNASLSRSSSAQGSRWISCREERRGLTAYSDTPGSSCDRSW